MAKPAATIDDVLLEVRQLRLELAAEREDRRRQKRRGSKRSRTVGSYVIADLKPNALHVAKAKRAIRRRLGL